ncbi:MAG: 30S ribosomal protein S12 methylthiotransferase RimO [Planctomycetota bacterium]|nr:MAG: 30S ribosomal protein S12 methylthiotransferase RimO [Planctomycetota bacterium]
MKPLPILDPGALPTEQPAAGVPATGSRGRFAFVSLGCPKNLVDSEKMLGTLALEGYTLVPDPQDADFVIVNTCGFIESAREESRGVIREMLELKRTGRIGGVIVAGCLPERLGGRLLEELPEVDHIVGVFARDEIQRVADRLVGNVREQRELFRPAPIKAMDDRARLRITPRHYAYLKISEGCDRTCTFCAIPKMRGKHVTKPIEQVLAEAEELIADGVRELILVAQDTTYYGIDLYGEPRLAELLQRLDRLDGVDWIRLMYLYPIHFTDELIDVIAGGRHILPYLDLPLQHINPRILRRMQRRVTREETIALLQRLRERIPNLVVRTTFITGFPGETDEEFQELCDFVADAKFERLGVFTYSREPGTPADRLPDHLPERVKEQRRETLMTIQQQNAFAFADSLVGYELDVLLDRRIDEHTWEGRTFADAPEIDAVVCVRGENLVVGDLVPVEITGRSGYDLVGEAVGIDPDD